LPENKNTGTGFRRLSRNRAPGPIEKSKDHYLATEAKKKPPSLRTLKRTHILGIATAGVLIGGFVFLTIALSPFLVQTTRVCPSGLLGSPTWSPDGKYIAYAAGECGTHIYVMPVAGGSARQVTTGRGQQPAWSPNGCTILYRSPAGFSVVPAGGGNPLLLHSDDGAYGAAWSPDGSRIAFTHGQIGDIFALAFTSTLYVMNSDGSNVRRVLGHSCNPGTPAWSPDGTKLAFTCDNGLNVMRLRDGRPTRIGTGDYAKGLHSTVADSAIPSWSPDGRTIALANMLGVQLFSADKVERPKTIVQGALFSAFAGSWSPDGRQLVYSIASTNTGGEASIYVIDGGGGQSRLLVSLP